MRWIGVDGCKTAWLFFALDGKRCEHGITNHVVELLDRYPEAESIFIDIPIGLRNREQRERRCDLLARRILGAKRASSIFPAPSRFAVSADSYEKASRLNKESTGRSLSKQTWAIVPKIREVDEVLQHSRRARTKIREVHPEVCFWALGGREAVRHSKKTQAGFGRRLKVLKRLHPQAENWAGRAFLHHAGKICRDDVIDALAIALAAAQGPTTYRTLPRKPERDSTGLPMEMVYAVI